MAFGHGDVKVVKFSRRYQPRARFPAFGVDPRKPIALVFGCDPGHHDLEEIRVRERVLRRHRIVMVQVQQADLPHRVTPAAFSRHGFRGIRSSSAAVAKIAFSSRYALAAVTAPTPLSRSAAFQLRTADDVIRFSAVLPNVG